MTTSLDTSRDRTGRNQTRPKTGPSWLARLGVILGVSLMILVGLWIGLRLSRSGVLPGVQVEGIDVGGMSHEQLQATIGDLAEDYRTETVTTTLRDDTVTVTNADLGYAFDVEETVERIWYRGRQGNPLASLGEHIRAFGETQDIAVVEGIDEDRLEAWAADTAESLEIDPVEGDVSIEGAEVTRTDPRRGATVPVDPLEEQGREALLSRGDDAIDVDAEPVDTITTTDDIDDAYARAERAVSAPIVLSRNGGTITLEPEDIGELVEVERTLGDQGASFELLLSSENLAGAISDETIAEMETDPVSSDISLQGGEIVITESSEGFRFDLEAATAQVLELMSAEAGDSGAREATLDGEILAPSRSMQEAQDLQIVEQVSSFTTNHQCCQARVTNIQRFADIVDGVVIEPGEEFSLNGHVGERTRAKGFVGGGAIFRGEFVEQVGGGVSQFATTFFNAAYFGGYEILQHKPHSYYISRYPVGRESTINYPDVDVRILNNSPYGILVDTSYTSTSITVSFWGKDWVDVDSVTGQRRNVKQPGVTYRENNELPAGSSRVIQEAGGPGFDITVTRILTYPDGETEREEFFTRYLPEDRIVERNT